MAHEDPAVEAQLLRLKSAEILAQDGRYQQSQDLALSLDIQLLPPAQRWQLLVLSVENALALDLGRQALQQMAQITLHLDRISLAQEFQLAGYRARAFGLTGHTQAAVQQRFNQTQLAPDAESRSYAEQALWQTLTQLSGEQLLSMHARERQADLRGWLELALVRQQTSADFGTFERLMNLWVQRWPRHPAHQMMPEDLSQLAYLSQIRIEHLGVFLPNSGPLAPAAEAIRNALIARHLQAIRLGQHSPRLSFYDTQSASLDQLYEQAMADQVEVIIGPLAKSRVDLLVRRNHLPLPTLALNYGNDAYLTNKDLFQFGLSAENEAQQVALKAWQSGFRTALALTPEGEWGDRVEQSFIKAWEELGGTLTLSRQVGTSASVDTALRQLLEVQLSQQRHQRLTRLLGERPHFVARPREDSDFLFLHAHQRTARQVKPALSFLLASNLTVLATSSVYSGVEDPAQDRDLDGIIFNDISWYLNPEDELQKNIRQAWPASMNRYGRFYALGVDAYLLAQRLELLEALPELRLDGATGRLGHQNRRIHRELEWAQFIGGRPQPLPDHALQRQSHVDQPLLD